ncbi:hypothetical protein ACHAW6_000651 [Cyclotella cf. meneghiniana]
MIKIYSTKKVASKGFLVLISSLSLLSGLMGHVISALGSLICKRYSHQISSPSKDSSGEPTDPIVPYKRNVDMLLNLSGHTCPDIAFAVHQSAHYSFKPTRHHVAALK